MKTKKFISNAKNEVGRIIAHSKVDSRTIIARYTAAVAVNFTDWIGKTIPWARHETARHALVDNLRCEAVHDHVRMLLNFAALSKAMPDREDYAHTYDEVTDIRKLFAEPTTAGLSGVALCAVLENTSEIFIPDLARRAKECGCTDFEYTNVHGEADVEHSDAFLRATEAEQTMGYRNPEYFVRDATELAVALIARIYAGHFIGH